MPPTTDPSRSSIRPLPSTPTVTLPGSYADESFVTEAQRRQLMTIQEETSAQAREDQDEVDRELARMDELDDVEEDPSKLRAERLYEEYTRDGSTRVSLKQEVSQYVNRLQWQPTDIVDYGTTIGVANRPRFALRPPILRAVDRVFSSLQTLLASLAYEVPARRARNNYHYILDPQGDLLPVLHGANSLAELSGAWEILRERLEKGSRFVTRYLEEAQGAQGISSPATTLSEVYRPFQPDAIPDQRIREYRALVPTHQKAGLSPPDVLDLARPLEELVYVPPQLQEAFPPREPESSPKAFSYKISGERQDMSHYGRTSYGADSGFAVPANYSQPESISTAMTRKNRTRGRDRYASQQNTTPVRTEEANPLFNANTNWSHLYSSTARVEYRGAGGEAAPRTSTLR